VLEDGEVGGPARRQAAALALGERDEGTPVVSAVNALGAREALALAHHDAVRMSRRATTAANATQGSAGFVVGGDAERDALARQAAVRQELSAAPPSARPRRRPSDRDRDRVRRRTAPSGGCAAAARAWPR